MGIGDEVMATGMARGAAARGKRIAFGTGRIIKWGPFSEEAFRYNPNIAPRGSEGDPRTEWVNYYKGHRIYNHQSVGRWIWNYDFKAKPGEFYFDDAEKTFATRRPMAVLLEPNVPWHKPIAVNKDWGAVRWQQLANMLMLSGIRVFQTSYGPVRLTGVHHIQVSTFRQTAAAISGFPLIIVPEGGLHHAAAAVGTPAIVIFGGCIPPAVLGYDSHINLTGGADDACGRWTKCQHCRDALDRITPEQVHGIAHAKLHQEDIAIPARAG